jgi:four helix bundle protein
VAPSRFDIYDRVFRFASRVERMNQVLSHNRRVNRTALSQLVDAAFSVGANLEEAKAGQTKADFHAKLRISLKEARESHYWLRILLKSGVVRESKLQPLVDEANAIVAILTTIAKRTNPRNPTPPPNS